MPKTPNYRFERSERAKSKALKKAEKLQAKAEKSDARKLEADQAANTQDSGGSNGDE
jgi:hypothetical protein